MAKELVIQNSSTPPVSLAGWGTEQNQTIDIIKCIVIILMGYWQYPRRKAFHNVLYLSICLYFLLVPDIIGVIIMFLVKITF